MCAKSKKVKAQISNSRSNFMVLQNHNTAPMVSPSWSLIGDLLILMLARM